MKNKEEEKDVFLTVDHLTKIMSQNKKPKQEQIIKQQQQDDDEQEYSSLRDEINAVSIDDAEDTEESKTKNEEELSSDELLLGVKEDDDHNNEKKVVVVVNPSCEENKQQQQEQPLNSSSFENKKVDEIDDVDDDDDEDCVLKPVNISPPFLKGNQPLPRPADNTKQLYRKSSSSSLRKTIVSRSPSTKQQQQQQQRKKKKKNGGHMVGITVSSVTEDELLKNDPTSATIENQQQRQSDISTLSLDEQTRQQLLIIEEENYSNINSAISNLRECQKLLREIIINLPMTPEDKNKVIIGLVSPVGRVGENIDTLILRESECLLKNLKLFMGQVRSSFRPKSWFFSSSNNNSATTTTTTTATTVTPLHLSNGEGITGSPSSLSSSLSSSSSRDNEFENLTFSVMNIRQCQSLLRETTQDLPMTHERKNALIIALGNPVGGVGEKIDTLVLKEANSLIFNSSQFLNHIKKNSARSSRIW